MTAVKNLQRVGFLAFVPELLRHLHADVAEVLHIAGLDAHALDNPENTIPYSAMGLLVQAAAEKTQCAHLGLEIGRQIRTSALGLLGELMRNAPTLGSALRDFASNQHRNAHGGVCYLIVEQQEAFFGYAVYEPNVAGGQVICDGTAMGAFTLVSELAGLDRASGLQVLLSRAEPHDLTPYRRAFGVKLSFNAEQTAIVMPRELLDRPVAGADPALRAVLDKRVRDLGHVGDMDTATHLRRELRVALLTGHISAVDIAKRMGMSRRTLHRRLDAGGINFQQVLSQTRCEFAQQLLANTRLGIGEIATIVGYTEPSVLTRGFIRWAGVTPSEWRAHLVYKLDECAALTSG